MSLDSLKAIKIGENFVDLSQNPEIAKIILDSTSAAELKVRNQLYPTISKLKDALAAGREIDSQAIPANGVPLTTQTLAQTLSTPAAPAANTSLTEDAIKQFIAAAINNSLPQLVEAKLNPVLEQVNSIQTLTVNDYKNRKMTELGELIIPEMITGKTVAEIDASIESSKAVRARFATTQNGQTPATQTPATTTGVITPVVPVTPTPTTTAMPNAGGDVINVSEMSMQDYAKQRDIILAALTKQYS